MVGGVVGGVIFGVVGGVVVGVVFEWIVVQNSSQSGDSDAGF